MTHLILLWLRSTFVLSDFRQLTENQQYSLYWCYVFIYKYSHYWRYFGLLIRPIIANKKWFIVSNNIVYLYLVLYITQNKALWCTSLWKANRSLRSSFKSLHGQHEQNRHLGTVWVCLKQGGFNSLHVYISMVWTYEASKWNRLFHLRISKTRLILRFLYLSLWQKTRLFFLCC